MAFCNCCCVIKERSSIDESDRNSILLVFTKEQVKSKIETQYKKFVSGELKCTPQEGAVIVNNYNSRRKICGLL